MGLCTVQSINASPPLLLPNPKPYIPIRQILTIRAVSLLSRSICLRNVLSKATTSEDSSSEASQFSDEKRDNAIVLGDVETVDKKRFNGINPKQELPVVEQEGLSLNVLDNLNIKFDADDTSSIVLYAGGVIVALWLTSAVIGAIDSIPLFPKLLEAVGLGYAVWFTSRYLLFKRNNMLELTFSEGVAKHEQGSCPIIRKNQRCREWKYALSGGCHFQFPGFACFCYFNG